VSTFERLSLEVSRWGLAVAVVGALINISLFVAVLLQLRLLRRSNEQMAEATGLDHDRRQKQATIELYRETLDRQRSWRSQGFPDYEATERIALFNASRPGSDEYELCRQYMNWAEQLAVGTKDRVYDLGLIYRLMGTRMIRTYWALEPWVLWNREHYRRPAMWCEYQDLVGLLIEEAGAQRNLGLIVDPVEHPVVAQ
jgi:hypothetical protein